MLERTVTTIWALRRYLAAVAVLSAFILASVAPAHQGVVDTNVLRRMNTMVAANDALRKLENMSSGRMAFDRTQARAARRNLITAIRTIPRRFRRASDDPATQARPEIWSDWSRFKTKAKAAKRAALAVRTTSRTALQHSLPRMIVACLDCHKAFRQPDR